MAAEAGGGEAAHMADGAEQGGCTSGAGEQHDQWRGWEEHWSHGDEGGRGGHYYHTGAEPAQSRGRSQALLVVATRHAHVATGGYGAAHVATQAWGAAAGAAQYPRWHHPIECWQRGAAEVWRGQQWGRIPLCLPTKWNTVGSE